MGLNLSGISTSQLPSNPPPTQVTATGGNPDPRNFEIVRHKVVNDYLILMIHYRGVENFEGKKVLIFERGVTLADLEKQDGIDPHFSDDKSTIHPIARFIPTTKGWFLAHRFAAAEKGDGGADA